MTNITLCACPVSWDVACTLAEEMERLHRSFAKDACPYLKVPWFIVYVLSHARRRCLALYTVAHGTETSRAAMSWNLFTNEEIELSRVCKGNVYKGSFPAQLGFGGVVLFGSKSVLHRHAALSEPVQYTCIVSGGLNFHHFKLYAEVVAVVTYMLRSGWPGAAPRVAVRGLL